MTIDERLERLTERHEALTQSVELLRLEGKEQNKRIAKQSEHIDKIFTAVEKDSENIRRLARIAELHHERLTHLEGGEDGG